MEGMEAVWLQGVLVLKIATFEASGFWGTNMLDQISPKERICFIQKFCFLKTTIYSYPLDVNPQKVNF